jgi:hypothetical protein
MSATESFQKCFLWEAFWQTLSSSSKTLDTNSGLSLPKSEDDEQEEWVNLKNAVRGAWCAVRGWNAGTHDEDSFHQTGGQQ